MKTPRPLSAMIVGVKMPWGMPVKLGERGRLFPCAISRQWKVDRWSPVGDDLEFMVGVIHRPSRTFSDNCEEGEQVDVKANGHIRMLMADGHPQSVELKDGKIV